MYIPIHCSVIIEAYPGSVLPTVGENRKFVADNGGNSSRTKGRRGNAAPDKVIRVPLGTCVYDGIYDGLPPCVCL